MVLEKILSKSKECGISSTEVSLAKDLVLNKCKDDKLIICEGLWAVDKLIKKNIKVTHFLFNKDKLESGTETEENLQKIAKMVDYAENSCLISQKSCQKISDREGFDEYFIIAEQPKFSLEDLKNLFASNGEVLGIVMDGLEQAGNIGAILRSFECAGGDFAIITNRQAKLTNSRLVRASLGASFLLPVVEADIETVQQFLTDNGFKIFVTDLKAKKSFKEASYLGRVAVIAGNEHRGISNSWRGLKNAESIIIPMYGEIESLNVGFASTLVAYEAAFQKNRKGK